MSRKADADKGKDIHNINKKDNPTMSKDWQFYSSRDAGANYLGQPRGSKECKNDSFGGPDTRMLKSARCQDHASGNFPKHRKDY